MLHAPVSPCPTCADRARAQTKAREVLAELTVRQLDIVRLVAEGLTNNEVSIRLNLCEKTIRNTLHLIFTNTYVTNRTQLARLVWEAGL